MKNEIKLHVKAVAFVILWLFIVLSSLIIITFIANWKPCLLFALLLLPLIGMYMMFLHTLKEGKDDNSKT